MGKAEGTKGRLIRCGGREDWEASQGGRRWRRETSSPALPKTAERGREERCILNRGRMDVGGGGISGERGGGGRKVRAREGRAKGKGGGGGALGKSGGGGEGHYRLA